MARTNGQELRLCCIGNLQNSAKLDGKRNDSESFYAVDTWDLNALAYIPKIDIS